MGGQQQQDLAQRHRQDPGTRAGLGHDGQGLSAQQDVFIRADARSPNAVLSSAGPTRCSGGLQQLGGN